MKRSIGELTEELVKLPRSEQLEIVKYLLLSDEKSRQSDQNELDWEKEISERIIAVDEGRATGVEYGEVLQQVELRFGT